MSSNYTLNYLNESNSAEKATVRLLFIHSFVRDLIRFLCGISLYKTSAVCSNDNVLIALSVCECFLEGVVPSRIIIFRYLIPGKKNLIKTKRVIIPNWIPLWKTAIQFVRLTWFLFWDLRPPACTAVYKICVQRCMCFILILYLEDFRIYVGDIGLRAVVKGRLLSDVGFIYVQGSLVYRIIVKFLLFVADRKICQ